MIETEVKKLITYLDGICIPESMVNAEELIKMSNEEIVEKLYNIATNIYETKKKKNLAQKR